MRSANRICVFVTFSVIVLIGGRSVFAQAYDFWQPMLHTEALQWPVPGHVVQFSSWDRDGGNSDMGYYYGQDQFGWNILCDMQGAGAVTQMWFTYGRMSDTSRIRIFVDDTLHAVIDTSMKRLFGHVSPFVPPLADSASGAWYTLVPIPFSSHCRITYRGNLIYYHVAALALNAGRTVTPFTFPPAVPYLAKLDSLRNRVTNPQQPTWITRPFQVVDTQAVIAPSGGGRY